MTTDQVIDAKRRMWIIGAALLALFLGAMDALIMSAAMPTIVAELGGMSLYAWVYSAYFLARAAALPIFGKLADLFETKKLFLFSIGLFLLSSNAFHAAALAAGGSDEGAPGPRPQYSETYYGAYVRDLDGNKLQAVCYAPD